MKTATQNVAVPIKKQLNKQYYITRKNIKKLKKELELSHAETVKVCSIWFEVFEDLEAEKQKITEQMEKKIRELEKKNLEMARQRDEALDKLRESKKAEYEAKTALQEAQDKIEALNIRISKDYTNSSKPSSQNPNHKKICNGRVKSGKNPGAQKNHEHHPRKKPENITQIVEIPPTEEILNNPDLKATEKYLVSCRLIVETTKFRTRQTTIIAKDTTCIKECMRTEKIMYCSLKINQYRQLIILLKDTQECINEKTFRRCALEVKTE